MEPEYRQLFAVRRNWVQRPANRAGAPSQISSGPTSSRMGVNGVIQLPRPTVTWLAIRPPAFRSCSRSRGARGRHAAPRPPTSTCGYEGSCLDSHVVFDGEEISVVRRAPRHARTGGCRRPLFRGGATPRP